MSSETERASVMVRGSVAAFGGVGGSIMALSKEASALAATFAPFDLEATKAHVERSSMTTSTPPRFRRYFASSAFDQLLVPCLQYFVAYFHHEGLKQALEKTTRLHHERLKPHLVLAKMSELHAKAEEHLQAVAPQYANCILQQSRPLQPVNDSKFFEALYAVLIACLVDALNGKYRAEVEEEVGRIFRSPSFNCYKRSNDGPRSIDTLSLRELHALRNENVSGLVNARLMASLIEPADTRLKASYRAPSLLIASRLTKGPSLQLAKGMTMKRDAGSAVGGGDAQSMRGFNQILFGGTVRDPASLTVHVDAAGLVENEITLEMARLARSIAQANLANVHC